MRDAAVDEHVGEQLPDEEAPDHEHRYEREIRLHGVGQVSQAEEGDIRDDQREGGVVVLL